MRPAPSSRSSRPAPGARALGRALGLALAAAAIVGGGCAATTAEAPAGAGVGVGSGAGAPPGASSGSSSGSSSALDLDHEPRLTEGRTLYTARCQSCHALPAPGRLAPEAWPAEVRGMSRKSGLSTDQVTLISEYLTAASRAVRPH